MFWERLSGECGIQHVAAMNVEVSVNSLQGVVQEHWSGMMLHAHCHPAFARLLSVNAPFLALAHLVRCVLQV
jgi:hypothetical protein